DVLYYADYIIEKKGLTIPHSQINKRNFVLAPLVELIPGFVDPVHRKTIKRLAELSTDKCRAAKYAKAI
ncbi:MAG: 2-amino-4-hydroxy-6-hydroxymethyldihydropteridine diphosphokinase, partial [Ignavibacteria bacterium]|nr:2-amino-4-hydroxy-6-hydroxymethyldihydropteridine diphosphokinase [Ignavibacteria bacterium]